ncbi:MAG: NOB1 family endonuclease [Promethearchaeota archaeon]
MDKAQISVFDTNIFLLGLDFNLIPGKIFTIPKIIEEIEVSKYKDKNRNILNRIYAAINNKKLVIKTPQMKYLQNVENRASVTGDYNALSEVDKELIALTLELIKTRNEKVVLYSNDYSIENVCSELKIPFESLYKKGIKAKILWEIYCPFCNKTHNPKDLNKRCEICGSKLKRRPKNNIIY